MAILQIKKQSDLEKRLRLLRQQVYGKSVDSSRYQVAREEKQLISSNTHTTNYSLREASQLPTTDITNLRQDLTKIALLATIAFSAQIILFYLLKNGLLKLNFL